MLILLKFYEKIEYWICYISLCVHLKTNLVILKLEVATSSETMEQEFNKNSVIVNFKRVKHLFYCYTQIKGRTDTNKMQKINSISVVMLA
jgi:hypothetical protein